MRAGTPGATAKAKDEPAKDTVVVDVVTATEYLVNSDFKSEDDELTFEFLSVIAMQFSQQPKLSAKKASEAFKALSYLILELHHNDTTGAITDAVARAVSQATNRVRAEMEEATELMSATAITSNNTAEEMREECRSVVMELKGAMEEVTVMVENAGVKLRLEAQGVGGGRRQNDADSYADSVKKRVPTMHAPVVARAELQKKRIRLIKATGMGGDGLGDLTEKQWVEKANMALTLMVGQDENKPEVVTFVGVSKEREGRGVIFELNTGEAAGWLKDKRVMSGFLAKMGSTVDFKMQTYEVVVDWVPVSFEVEQPAAWKSVERSNNLRESAIQEATWIKPIHLRSEGQRTAIAIFRMATREDANQIIEHGLYVEGKKVWGRKQAQEPKRCLKCQCFGEHKAAKCASIHEVCGRCSKQHRTSSCEENSKDRWECSNCKAAGNGNHKGHGAADRRCPIFLNRVERMYTTRQENRYKFFCTNDPATWETHERYNAGEQHTADLHEQGRKEDDQRRKAAKGRLGGGERGDGGGGATQRQTGLGVETRAPRNGNGPGVGGGNNSGSGGGRTSRQDGQKGKGLGLGPGPVQTTLSDMWKDRDMRSWSEDMDSRMRELEKGRQDASPHV